MIGGKATIRLKLTLLYGGLFVISGLILIGGTYGLVRRELGIAAAPRPISDVITDRIEDRQEEGNGEDPDEREERARREERRRALQQLWRQALFALAITTAGSLGLGWIVAGRVLDPIRQITDHAKHASATTLNERIALEGPEDELKELADTFDDMLDRLQAAFLAQQGFAAQASHELRTPLAIIRAEAEVAAANPTISDEGRATSAAILTAVDRSEQLIDGLLALARSESTMLSAGPVDLADLTGDVVGEQVRDADAAGVRLDLQLDSAIVRGDRVLLSRMIGNLVQNGIRYNVRGGSVSVSLRSTGSEALIQIENTGPIVTPEELQALFEPFVRGQWGRRNRSGFGLGLAIVKSVATVHSGGVVARSRAEGGLVVSVTLPNMVVGRHS